MALSGVTDIVIPVMRYAKMAALLDNIEATTPEPHRIICVSDDPDRIESPVPHTDIKDDGASWGARINRAYRESDGAWLFTGQDDVQFCEGWLTAALRAMEDQFGNAGGVVTVHDGCNARGTMALVARSYIEEMSGCVDEVGVVYHEGYRHAFAETELFETARTRGRWTYCQGSVVEHHWRRDGMDETYQIGDDHYLADKRHHMTRAAKFGPAPMRVVVPYTGTLAWAVGDALDATGWPWVPYDVSADDHAYWRLVRDLWADVVPFMIVEHDVIVTSPALDRISECDQLWCANSYQYLGSTWAGLGCTRFAEPLMHAYPELIEEAANPTYPGHETEGRGQHWCTLDTAIERALTARGEQKHIHSLPITHRNGPPSHGCHS